MNWFLLIFITNIYYILIGTFIHCLNLENTRKILPDPGLLVSKTTVKWSKEGTWFHSFGGTRQQYAPGRQQTEQKLYDAFDWQFFSAPFFSKHEDINSQIVYKFLR